VSSSGTSFSSCNNVKQARIKCTYLATWSKNCFSTKWHD
jgi:hypothetical protein